MWGLKGKCPIIKWTERVSMYVCIIGSKILSSQNYMQRIPVSSERVGQNVVESIGVGGKAVEIVKGDTLWGLSTKYGVHSF